MARWLKRIDPRRKKSKSAPPVDQTYEVRCGCGERAIGMRMSRYQQVICKQCGEPLFVLPANVYPAPPPPEPKTETISQNVDADALREAAEEEPLQNAANKQKPTPEAGGVLGELADESWKSTKAGKEESRAEERKRKSEARQQQREKAKTKRESQRQEREENPLTKREPIRVKVRRLFSPFRIIVVSITALVIATIAWQVHSRNVESARLTFDTARKKAATLLEEKKFVEAAPVLQEAVEAVELLGRNDVPANRIRRLNLEVEVINDLSQTSFYEAVNTATTAAAPDVKAILMTQLAERWIVFDTLVRSDGRVEEQPRYVVDIPMLVNDALLSAFVVGGELGRLQPGPDGVPAVFAARIKDCSFRQGDPATLQVELEGSSIRLWSDPGTFAALGFPMDELPPHLASQQKLLGAAK